MSDTNDINFKGTGGDTTDAEGHAIRSGRLDDGAQDDAEGHAIRSGRLDDGSQDDAEGHAKVEGVPGKPYRRG